MLQRPSQKASFLWNGLCCLQVCPILIHFQAAAWLIFLRCKFLHVTFSLLKTLIVSFCFQNKVQIHFWGLPDPLSWPLCLKLQLQWLPCCFSNTLSCFCLECSCSPYTGGSVSHPIYSLSNISFSEAFPDGPKEPPPGTQPHSSPTLFYLSS